MPAWGRPAAVALLAVALQGPQFKSGVDVVRFDVVVLDKDRHPIAGLTAQDFHVTENGQPLRIAGFEAVTIPAAAPTPRRASESAPAPYDLHVDTVTNHRSVPGRLVVVVIDWTIPTGQPIVTARRIANAAIDALGPNDLAAVVFSSTIAGNRLQGLTADRDRLRAAVASAQMGTPTDVAMTGKGLAHGGLAVRYGACYCGLCTMQTLAGVADAVASVPGYQKMILFIGGDLPLAENSEAGGAAGCQGLFREAREKLLQAIDRGSVTVHSLNPRGLETGAVGADAFPSDARQPASERLIREGNLRTLPEYTGGRSVVGVNQPENLVPAIFEESRTYYVLAVERAPSHRNGQPHTVRIDVARSEASVVSRTNYLDAVAESTKKASADPLERALSGVLPQTDLPLSMTLAPGTAKNTSLDVTLSTPLTTSARADVLVGVFDDLSKPVGSERAKVELPASSGGGDTEWKMHLNPKPGHYEVRAAVRIGTELGSITGYVDVTPAPRTEEKPDGKPGASKLAVRRARTAPSTETAALLQRAAAYLEQYADPSNGLLLDEKYTQQVNTRPPRIRELRSDLLILPDAAEGWLQFRDVMAVDGKAVADRSDRLMRLFASPAADARDQARRIADEGARYNISGSVTLGRTLNLPMVALLYVRGAAQSRSDFEPQGRAGSGGQRLVFTELGSPTLIGVSGGEPATGTFWIDPSSGRVLRSELHVVSRSKMGTASATIRVQYAYDAKTQLMLPAGMEEHYMVQAARGSVETIDGEATYSNPRQFRASSGGS